MVTEIKVTLDAKAYKKLIKEARKSVAPASIRRALKLIGIEMLSIIDKHFKKSSQSKGRWRRISPFTALMRRGGAGNINSFADAAALARTLPILINRGRLARSFNPKINFGGRIFDLRKLKIEVGTNVPYAAIQHEGGQSTFPKWEDVRTRIGKHIPRSPGPGGEKWNKFYFIIRSIIRKKAGTSSTIPARSLIPKFGSARQARLRRILFENTLGKINGKRSR